MTHSAQSTQHSLTVALTFDFDAISVWIGSMGSKSPSAISRGEFGVVGTRRLLELLRRHDLSATWFIPGHTIDTFPDTCREIFEAGHEVGHHNYCHENPRTMDATQERAVIERGIACIEGLTGKRPAGYRSPAADHSANTVPLLVELGFAYDSSLMADDFTPYYARAGDEIRTDGPFRFGPRVPLVELPIDWSLDDWPYFGLNWNSHHVGLRTPDEVFAIWTAEFDFAAANVPGGLFTLVCHPQIIGRGHRLAMLERLIEHMTAAGATFTTLGEAAAAWRAANPFTR